MLHPNGKMPKYFKLHPDMRDAAMFPAYDRYRLCLPRAVTVVIN